MGYLKIYSVVSLVINLEGGEMVFFRTKRKDHFTLNPLHKSNHDPVSGTTWEIMDREGSFVHAECIPLTCD